MEWFYYIQGYPLIFITTLIEGISIPFPGGYLLAWSGFVLGRDMSDLAMATGLGVMGYTLGAIVPYLVGRIGGRPLIEKLFKRFHLSFSHIDLAEKWFTKHGLIIVAFSRPFLLGNYVSFVAGMAKTRLLPFLICTGLGICPWVIAYLYLGMLFGRHWRKALELVSQYSVIVSVLAILFVLVFIYRRKLLHIR
ncbi:MAG: DedA family protein [Clostridia bacterium]|nr:DedA family protein [Clostridia bacterium]